jgi:hypothetical protein
LPSSTSIIIANFIPCRLQLQPSSPSTSILVANFIPHRHLQPSSPSTSTLVAFQFPNPVAFLFPPFLLDARGVLDAAAATTKNLVIYDGRFSSRIIQFPS